MVFGQDGRSKLIGDHRVQAKVFQLLLVRIVLANVTCFLRRLRKVSALAFSK